MKINQTSLDNLYEIECEVCAGKCTYTFEQLKEHFDESNKRAYVDCKCDGDQYIRLNIDALPYAHVAKAGKNESEVDMYCISKLDSDNEVEYFLFAFVKNDKW